MSTKDYTLLDPITLESGEVITSLVLARPSSGRLRGFSLATDMQDVDAEKYLPLIQRMCIKPRLTSAQLDELSGRDFVIIAQDIALFLSNQSPWEQTETRSPGPIVSPAPLA